MSVIIPLWRVIKLEEWLWLVMERAIERNDSVLVTRYEYCARTCALQLFFLRILLHLHQSVFVSKRRCFPF